MALAGIGKAIFTFVKFLVTTAVGKAVIGWIVKVAFMAFFLLALAGAGLLPPSPFRMALGPLTALMGQIPYMQYVAVFVPFGEIMGVLVYWLAAVTIFHAVKALLRLGGIIK